ncbi:hypothetical protein MKW92_028591 [Papaver armeniacum]|nr:hypothetical protein MKW92_028591 [Papaver armeniacum]
MEAFDEFNKPADHNSLQLNGLFTNEELQDLKSSIGRIIHDAFEKAFGQKTYTREDPEGASRITSKSNQGGRFSSDEGDSTKSTEICDQISESVAQDLCVDAIDKAEKWVEMKGNVVPIMKLERLAREDLDICRKMYMMWLKTTNWPTRDYWLAKRIKWIDMAEKKLE